MKQLTAIFFASIFCIVSSPLKAQENIDFCEQTQALLFLLENKHLAPKPIDNTFSEAIFDLFLDKVDPYKRFLIKEDSLALAKDRQHLDDFLKNNTCSFIENFSNKLAARIIQVRSQLNTLRDANLDYSGVDTLYLSVKNLERILPNEKALDEYWNKTIRFKTLSSLIENDSVVGNIQKNFATLEKNTRQGVIDKELCELEGVFKSDANLLKKTQEHFLNAITGYYDPNSTFFNVSEKVSFENSVATTSLSFGFSIDRNNSYDLIVSGIVPGSPAFFNDNFEENDIIISLSSGNETLNTSCIAEEVLDNFIFDPLHNKVTFTLKKKTGTIINVTLEKSDQGEQKNTVLAYVLQRELPVGYLQFSSFYTDLESPNGLGIANDVAKQLFALKKSNIEALIIDLRNNGGGSLKEAVDLCGMFIDKGPVAIFGAKDELELLGDSKKGVLFSKPILVLINGFSASASELFAGVMQDYNRALIVGSTTYGKSSSQRIDPLLEDISFGYTKVTTHQFFRVTGKSIQSRGIIPDIVVPDVYDNFTQAEKYLPYALKNTSVKVTMPHKSYSKLNLSPLIISSAARVEKNKMFYEIQKINKTWIDKVVSPAYHYQLSLEAVYGERANNELLWKTFLKFQEEYSSSLTVLTTETAKKLLIYDPEKRETDSKIREELQKDPAIEEAYEILTELLKIK
jgi:carboxyl-terminal processing protease